MLQKFKSMDELLEYLGNLEERVRRIEAENRLLREPPIHRDSIDGNAIVKSVLRSLPQTNLFSFSFLKRAFAVWGHFFVANLIIGIAFAIVYFCLVAALFSSFIQSSR